MVLVEINSILYYATFVLLFVLVALLGAVAYYLKSLKSGMIALFSNLGEMRTSMADIFMGMCKELVVIKQTENEKFDLILLRFEELSNKFKYEEKQVV